jgi:hypothetical protein
MKQKYRVATTVLSVLVAMTVLTGSAICQVIVNLTPLNPPIQIPASGGIFEYNIEITNPGVSSQNFDVWCMATLPDCSSYGPVLGPVNLTMPGGSSNNRDRMQDVPPAAPAGDYTYTGYVGIYPDTIWSSDSFPFEKLGAPDTLWTQTFGGSGWDIGYSVQQTQDGGYIVAGFTSSFGAGYRDVFLIKTDTSGNSVWTQTVGGSNLDEGHSVQQTQDGGYIIAGVTVSFGAGWRDVFLIKTDTLGNQDWTQTFGGSYDDQGYSVQQTQDGGYIIAGYTVSFGAGLADVYLIKTDSSGNPVWTQTFGGGGADKGYSVQQTQDGGYIISGETYSFGPAGYSNVYLIKTNASGNLVWSQTFYGGNYWDIGRSVQQTQDGGYIITGDTHPTSAWYKDVYMIKTDASGNEEWTQTFGGIEDDEGHSVKQTAEGGFIIAGYTFSYGAGFFDVYLIKTNASGNPVWTQTFGGSSVDYGYSVQQTQDGGYIIAGATTSFGAGERDVYLIRLAPETDVNRLFGIPPEAEILGIPSDYSLSQNYPNPFNPTTTISFQLPVASRTELKIYDISGRFVTELINGWRDAGQHEVTFDGSNLASGMYIYRLNAGEFEVSGKMVLIK